MVASTCFHITLSSSGRVSSAFWEMLNWGAVDRILWMWRDVAWCERTTPLDTTRPCLWKSNSSNLLKFAQMRDACYVKIEVCLVVSDMNLPQIPFLRVKLYQAIGIAVLALRNISSTQRWLNRKHCCFLMGMGLLRTFVTATYVNLQYKENIV
jgi:hypothetical protein